MNDKDTTLRDLKEMIRQFVRERDWEQFHSPKNLAMSIAIEAAELMEHFQWETGAESRSAGEDSTRLEKISDEIADVLVYTLGLADKLDIDTACAVKNKMEKNRAKYPAGLVRGSRKKYTEYKNKDKE